MFCGKIWWFTCRDVNLIVIATIPLDEDRNLSSWTQTRFHLTAICFSWDKRTGKKIKKKWRQGKESDGYQVFKSVVRTLHGSKMNAVSTSEPEFGQSRFCCQLAVPERGTRLDDSLSNSEHTFLAANFHFASFLTCLFTKLTNRFPEVFRQVCWHNTSSKESLKLRPISIHTLSMDLSPGAKLALDRCNQPASTCAIE